MISILTAVQLSCLGGRRVCVPRCVSLPE